MSEHLTIEILLSELMNANQRAHLLTCVECQGLQKNLNLIETELSTLNSSVDFYPNKDVQKLIRVEAKRIRFEIWMRRGLQYVLPAAAVFIIGFGIFTKEVKVPKEADRLAEVKEMKTAKVVAQKSSINQFDVIDTFRLARALENKSFTEELQYDLNHNGSLDEDDLLQLRRQIVSLGANQ